MKQKQINLEIFKKLQEEGKIPPSISEELSNNKGEDE